MNDNIRLFQAQFDIVKARGWVCSKRTGNTGIGKTLEDEMGVAKNNLDIPDLHGIEIKFQRKFTDSYITLFTRVPTMPKRANNYLRTNFGSKDREFPDMKVLHTSVFFGKDNSHISGYSYALELDDNEQKLFLLVKSDSNVISRDVYWSYEVLRNIIENKLEVLALVLADEKIETDGTVLFRFQSCKLYSGATFKKFLELVRDGFVMFDLRIGCYKMGKNKGKTHDHGSGFRIKRDNFARLYDEVIEF